MIEVGIESPTDFASRRFIPRLRSCEIFLKVHRIMSKTIVVVHGTFAASKEGVTQWYELGKDHKHSFMNQVEAAVRSRGDVSSITWRVFRWSGANVHGQRLAAAEALYAEIRALLAASPTDELFLMSPSGNGRKSLAFRRSLEVKHPCANIPDDQSHEIRS